MPERTATRTWRSPRSSPPACAGSTTSCALEPAYAGQRLRRRRPQRIPGSLHSAIDLLEGSAIARDALGDEVVDHYLHYARMEQRTFDAAVTDWERFRGFERM